MPRPSSAANVSVLNQKRRIALQGTDEATGQTVHARSSYGSAEVVFYAKFSDLLSRDRDGQLSVDIGKLNQFQPLGRID